MVQSRCWQIAALFSPQALSWLPLLRVPSAACRVWDIRTKVQVHCLSGHEDTVAAILAMPTDPQVRQPRARSRQRASRQRQLLVMQHHLRLEQASQVQYGVLKCMRVLCCR